MRANVLGKARPQIAFFSQGVELAGSNFYDGEFARDKKSIERDEGRDHQQFPKNNDGRTPLISHRRGDCQPTRKN